MADNVDLKALARKRKQDANNPVVKSGKASTSNSSSNSISTSKSDSKNNEDIDLKALARERKKDKNNPVVRSGKGSSIVNTDVSTDSNTGVEQNPYKMTESEFNKRGSVKNKYGTYQNYLDDKVETKEPEKINNPINTKLLTRAEYEKRKSVNKKYASYEEYLLNNDVFTKANIPESNLNKDDVLYQKAQYNINNAYGTDTSNQLVPFTNPNSPLPETSVEDYVTQTEREKALKVTVNSQYEEKYNNASDEEKRLLLLYYDGDHGEKTPNIKKRLIEEYGYKENEIRALSDIANQERNAEEAANDERIMKNYASEHPVSASVMSWANGVIGGIPAAYGMYKDIKEARELKKSGSYYDPGIDVNNPYGTAYRDSKAIKEQVMADHNWNVNAFGKDIDMFDEIYGTGMSYLESTATGLVPGGKVGFFLNAGMDTVYDLTERGASTEQAIAGGIAAGSFEFIFESFSIGKLKSLAALEEGSVVAKDSIKETVKNVALRMAEQTVVNASEETLTEIANILYDTLANGDISNYQLMMSYYQQNHYDENGNLVAGVSEEEAKKMVAKDFGWQVAEAGFGGALMGLGAGAGGSAVNIGNTFARNTVGAKSTGKNIRQNNNTDAVLDVAKTLPNDSVTAKKLHEYERKADLKGEEISDRQLGRIYQELVDDYNDGSINEEQKKAVDQKLEEINEARKEAEAKKNQYKENGAIDKQTKMDVTNPEIEINGQKTRVYDSGEYFKGSAEGEEAKHVSVFKKKNGKLVFQVNAQSVDADVDGKAVKQIKAQDVELNEKNIKGIKDNDVRTIFEHVLKKNLSAEAANLLLENYDGESVSMEYVNAFDTLKKQGELGSNEFAVLSHYHNEHSFFTEDNAKAIMKLGFEERKINSGLTDMRTVKQPDKIQRAITDFQLKVINDAAKKRNMEVIIVDDVVGKTKDGWAYMNGANLGDNRIVISSKADGNLLLSFFGHEQGHTIAREDAETFNLLKDKAQQLYKIDNRSWEDEINDLVERGYTKDKAEEEAVANILYRLYDRDTLEQIVAKKPKFVKGLIKIIDNIINGIEANTKLYAGRHADMKVLLNQSDEAKAILSDIKKLANESLDKIGEKYSNYVGGSHAVYEAYKTGKPFSYNGVKSKYSEEALGWLDSEYIGLTPEEFKAKLKDNLAESGIDFDEKTQSVSQSIRFTLDKTNYKAEELASMIAEVTGRSYDDAKRWVDAEQSLAAEILENPEYLDFEPDDRYEAIKNNSDYPQGTVDLSNLCPKRVEFTNMFDKLQKMFPHKMFDANDIAQMRQILSDNDIEIACGACFVEDRRQKNGEIAAEFIDKWSDSVKNKVQITKHSGADLKVTKEMAEKYGLKAGDNIYADDSYVPTQYDLTTYEGFKKLAKEHPSIAYTFEAFNNSRGQQSGRLIEGRAEYKRQILEWSPDKVKKVNDVGGLRIFSFSDFEVAHMLDLVQIIMDCSAKGVMIQGYTKRPEFARLIRNTGIKINRSLIPTETGIKIVDGKKVLDYDLVEGINIEDENFLDERDNDNVGNILIGVSDEQIGLAMLDDFVDYIIPFHSNKAKDILMQLGVGKWENYKYVQTEKNASTMKRTDDVNIYTDVLGNPEYTITNKHEFVDAFLQECKKQNKIPRYSQFLNVDEHGDFSYREGYHKLIIDFKLFDKEGNILPQGKVTPDLDLDFMKSLMAKEVDEKSQYKFPQHVFDELVDKFGDEESKTNFSISDRDYFDAVEKYGEDSKEAKNMVENAASKAGALSLDVNKPTHFYHGTPRADRVGTVFREDRATAGPMVFFSSSKDIATNYSNDKKDTSIDYDENYSSYEKQFRVTYKGKDTSIVDLWNMLPQSKKNDITRKAAHIGFDDELENIVYDAKNNRGTGGFDQYRIRDAKGNYLQALVDEWLNGGNLFGEESKFIDVLNLAGIDDVTYNDPNKIDKKVYDTYLMISNPFDATSMVDDNFINSLYEYGKKYESEHTKKESISAYAWDKYKQNTDRFIDRLKTDMADGTSHAWTVIPDFVTSYLESLGYDGVIDKGGKYTEADHTVVIPFHSEQVKSADVVTYDGKGKIVPISERFNPENKDINFSASDRNADIYKEKYNLNNQLVSLMRKESELKNSEAYKSLFEIDDIDEFSSKYETFEKETGYGDITKSINDIKKRLESINKTIDDEYVSTVTNKENEAIKKSGKSKEDYFRTKAKKIYGFTDVWERAAYMLPNGRMLDFGSSENKGLKSREQDHRNIGQIFANKKGSDAMNEFIGQGNIRVMGESPGIDISSNLEPTNSQYNMIKKFAEYSGHNKAFYVDFTNSEGIFVDRLVYEGIVSPERIVNDIKNFYLSGKASQSIVQQFHSKFSASDRNDINAVNSYYADLITENNFYRNVQAVMGDVYSQIRNDVEVSTRSVHAVANRILKNSNSKLDVEALTDDLLVAYDYMVNSSKNGTYNLDDLMKFINKISQNIVENSSGLDWSTYYDHKPARDLVSNNTIYVDEHDRKEIENTYGSFASWKHIMSYLNNKVITDLGDRKGNYTTLDSLGSEAAANFPGEFGEPGVPYSHNENGTSIHYDSYAVQLADFIENKARLKKFQGTKYWENVRQVSVEDAINLTTIEILKEFVNVKQFIAPEQKVLNQAYDLKRKYDKKEKELGLSYKRREEEIMRNWESDIRDLNAGFEMFKIELENEANKSIKDKMKDYTERQETKERRRVLKNKAERSLRYLNTRLTNPDRTRHIPEGQRNLVDALLKAIPIGNGGRFSRDKLGNLIAEYDKAMKNYAYLLGEDSREQVGIKIKGDIEYIQNKLCEDKATGQPGARVRDLTKADIEVINDVVEHVKFLVDTDNKLFADNRRDSLNLTGVDALLGLNKKQSKDQGGQGIKNKAIHNMALFKAGITKPEYLMKNTSPALYDLYKKIRQGENTEAKLLREAQSRLQQIKKDVDYDPVWRDHKNKIVLENNLELGITDEGAMYVYALSKRNQGMQHLVGENGGVTIVDEFTGKRKTFRLNENDVNTIIDSLTDKQKRYVDNVMDYLSEDIAAQRNAVSKTLYGIELYKEKNYVPIQVDKTTVDTNIARPEKMSGIANQGSSKQLNKKATNPIQVSNFSDVINKHIYDSVLYCSYAVNVENLKRVFNFRNENGSVHSALKDVVGIAGLQQINKLFTDIDSGQMQGDMMPLNAKMMSRAKKAAVMANMSVIVQQPTAVFRAMLYIDPKYFVTVAKKSDIEEMYEWNGCAVKKQIGYFDVNMGKSAIDFIDEYKPSKEVKKNWDFKDSFKQKHIMQKVDDIASIGANKADEITWGAIWNACKKQIAEQNPELEGDAMLQKASELFQDTIANTQVYDSVFTKPEYMRSKEGFKVLATAFMSEPLTSFNMLADSVNKVISTNSSEAWKTFGRAFACYAASLISNAAIKSLVYAMRDDDDDKSFWEKYIGRIPGSMADDIFGLVPYMSDIINTIDGWDVGRMDMTWMSTLGDLVKIIEKDNIDKEKLIKTLLQAGSQLTGVAGYNVYRDILALSKTSYNLYENIRYTMSDGKFGKKAEPTTARGVLESVKDNLPKVKTMDMGERMYQDIINGDIDDYSKVYNNMIEASTSKSAENSADNKVASALAKDERIADVYNAIADGDMDKRDAVYDELIAQGFNRNTVNKAVKDYENNLVDIVSDDPRTKEAAEARYNMDYQKYMLLQAELTQTYPDYNEEIVNKAITKELPDLNKSKKDFEAEDEEALKKSYDVYNAIYNGTRDDVANLYNTMLKNGVSEEAANKQVYEVARSSYKSGDLSETDYEFYATKYGGKSEDDLFWDEESANSGEGFKKYDRWVNAVKNNSLTDDDISYYLEHGVKKETLYSNTDIKAGVLDGSIDPDVVVNAYVKLGYDYKKAYTKVYKTWLKNK